MTSFADMQAQAAAGSPFVIRPGRDSDAGFVAKAWAETFRGSEGWVKKMEPGYFNRCIYPAVQDVLTRAELRIAGPPDDEETIYGFAVLEPGLVHMVYTRLSWRKMGIARALLQDVDLPSSQWSTQSGDFLEWIRFKVKMKSYRPFWMVEEKRYVHA